VLTATCVEARLLLRLHLHACTRTPVSRQHCISGCRLSPAADICAALLLQRCATAGDSCNDILMLDGKMPAIVVSGCTRSKQ
jgi:predicted mannosyl-3-phosphoglycerate phosphatase (HAD superfamily)